MSQNSQQLLAEALELPKAERGRLAAMLIDSLEAETDDNTDQDWSAEIERRLKEIEEGRIQLIPWSEVRARMRGSDETAG